MRRRWLIGILLFLVAVPLAAQSGIGIGSTRGSRVSTRPPSTPTPGVGRSPGASPLPATPGASRQVRPHPQPFRERHDRVFGRGRGFRPIYGYGYGGVYIDAGAGPLEAPREDQTKSGNSYVITVPPREKKAPPNPRVYNVREDLKGNVEMRPIRAAEQRSDIANPLVGEQYWLIALRSGLIYAAERYSAEKDTFQFTTRDGTEFVVSRSEIDLPFTEQLNRDLGWSFGYP